MDLDALNSGISIPTSKGGYSLSATRVNCYAHNLYTGSGLPSVYLAISVLYPASRSLCYGAIRRSSSQLVTYSPFFALSLIKGLFSLPFLRVFRRSELRLRWGSKVFMGSSPKWGIAYIEQIRPLVFSEDTSPVLRLIAYEMGTGALKRHSHSSPRPIFPSRLPIYYEVGTSQQKWGQDILFKN